ncbi:hypothetical protein ACHWQZ_G006302 [Mnemiopsis leidyi]
MFPGESVLDVCRALSLSFSFTLHLRFELLFFTLVVLCLSNTGLHSLFLGQIFCFTEAGISGHCSDSLSESKEAMISTFSWFNLCLATTSRGNSLLRLGCLGFCSARYLSKSSHDIKLTYLFWHYRQKDSNIR